MTFGMFDPFAQEKAKENEPSDLVTKVFIPLGSTLVAVIAFLVEHDKLPRWVFVIGGGYLSVVMAILLYKPVQGLIAHLSDKSKKCFLARRYLPKLVKVQAELAEMLDSNRTNTLRTLLTEMAGWTEVDPRPVFDSRHLESLRCWLLATAKRLNNSRDFLQCTSDLSVVVAHLNQIYVQKHQEMEALIIANKLSNQRLLYLKREWNLRRERHANFVREWGALSKTINSWAGPDTCGEYYQELASLE